MWDCNLEDIDLYSKEILNICIFIFRNLNGLVPSSDMQFIYT